MLIKFYTFNALAVDESEYRSVFMNPDHVVSISDDPERLNHSFVVTSKGHFRVEGEAIILVQEIEQAQQDSIG